MLLGYSVQHVSRNPFSLIKGTSECLKLFTINQDESDRMIGVAVVALKMTC